MKQAEEEKQKLIAELEAFKRDPWELNLKHLKLLELQPSGKTTAQNISFPSCKEDFELLRKLGKDCDLKELKLHTSYPTTPEKSLGVELSYN